MAVAGGALVTQEQRGEQEAVVCYDANTGDELWSYTHEARFDTMLAGIGPRATPTISGNRVYAMGALGMLTCHSIDNGELIWKFDLAEQTGSKGPEWGFSSSPLVQGERVIIYGGGENDNSLLGLDAETGKPVCRVGAGTPSYSSPQFAALCEQDQILMFTGVRPRIVRREDTRQTLGIPMAGFRCDGSSYHSAVGSLR